MLLSAFLEGERKSGAIWYMILRQLPQHLAGADPQRADPPLPLGRGWGESDDPDCSGIAVEDLSRVDWERVNRLSRISR